MGNKKNERTKIKQDIFSKAEDDTTLFECDYCPFETMDMNVLTKHVANCCSSDQLAALASSGLKDNLQFVCPICNQTFKYETGLKKHRQRHEPPGGFICSHCNERFLTEAERILHKDTVHKVYKCMICSATFESEKLFFDHINGMHDGKDREYFICNQCGKHFRLRNQLKLHVESKCGTEKSYTCNFCHSMFLNQYTLKTHIQIHVGKKKYLCGFCAASFLSRGQLLIHERSHTKDKPHICSLCNKSFSHRESLVTHSSIHTGIKPYICECCSSQFSCVGNLIKHRKARPETCGLSKYSNKKCAPRASTKVPGISMKRQPNRSTTQSAHEPEFLSVEVLDHSQSIKEETQPVDFVQQSIESCHLNQSLYSTSSGDEMIFISENNEFIASHENDNNIPVKQDDDNLQQSNKFEIIVEGQSGDDFPLTDDIPGENWQFLNTKTENVDDNLKSYSSSNGHSMIVSEEFENNCNELLFGVSGDNSETASTHYLKVEPIIDVVTHDTINFSQGKEATKTEIYECDMCQKQFYIKKSLAMHFAMVHRKRTEFNCKYCSKMYWNQKILDKHVIAHGENGKLIHKCPCCRNYYASEAEMQQHARKEHEDRLKCFICNKFYKNLDSIDAHNRSIHGNSKSKKTKQTYVCATCGRKYYSHRALADHEQSDCGQRPIYKCEHCQKAYHSFGSLKTHQLIHSGDLPFACSFCGKQFRTLGQVKVHERCHTKEKPFKCSVLECGKSFGHRASLVTHMSLHTGLKRFLCQCCSSRFSCISNLKAHRRTHLDTCGQVPLITKAQYGYSLADMQ